MWAKVKQDYTDHNPSVTITYKVDEYMLLGSILYRDYWNIAQGLSFLPRTDHVYQQAPYETITHEEYYRLKEEMPTVDWSLLSKYELEDNTKSGQAFACISEVPAKL